MKGRLSFLQLGVIFFLSGFFYVSHPSFSSESLYSLEILGFETSEGNFVRYPTAQGPAKILLALLDHRTGKRLKPDDLAVVHEKKFHLFFFDLSLSQYMHEHPEYQSGGVWVLPATFPRGGQYQAWADITLASNQNNLKLRNEIPVAALSGAEPLPAPSTLPWKLEGEDRGSIFKFEGVSEQTGIAPNEMLMLTMRFARADGSSPQITPYLGAMAHVVITPIGGAKLLHVHPMEMDGEWMIHTVFPHSGDYRAFVQFLDAGQLRTVQLSFKVK